MSIKKEHIQSIVPLMPAQQFMLSASLKSSSDTYVQQLVFEIKSRSWEEICKAIEKLIQQYECFRSVILYEGLRVPVWVSAREIHPPISLHRISSDKLFLETTNIRKKGFAFQSEPCLRFDGFDCDGSIFLSITNHHILFDGWGKQQLLNDFVLNIKTPNRFVPEKTNRAWNDAWKKKDQSAATKAYESYLLAFTDIAEITPHPEDGDPIQLELKDRVNASEIRNQAIKTGLTSAEYINFTWACFIAIWTQQNNIQFGVVKQNGLIEEVTNGFGLGIQTLPFQMSIDFSKPISLLLTEFKQRERSVAGYSYVDTTNSLFQQLNYSFIIAYENYPVQSSLNEVADDFIVTHSYDFTEFPLSLALSPEDESLVFYWHYHSASHSTEQVSEIAAHFKRFVLSFDQYASKSIAQISKTLFPYPVIKHPAPVSESAFFDRIENHLSEEEKKRYTKLSSVFSNSVQRIWIYGDKHVNTSLVILSAWKSAVEVITINEKETDKFIDQLFYHKPPDAIFVSQQDGRFAAAHLLDNIDEFEIVKNKVEDNQPKAALCICTSGSTGEPKIVQLSLQNMIHFFEAWDQKIPWRQNETFAAIAHPAFDIGVAELIFPKWKGWKAVLVTKEILADDSKIKKTFEGITAFHMVPALLDNWLEKIEPQEKEWYIMTGGDKVPQTLYEKIKSKLARASMFQFYGPSECSVLITGFENTGQFKKNVLPLGTTFSHGDVWVLHPNGTPAAPFQEAELVVLGEAVGLGYSNHENSQKFILLEGIKAFKTGDQGFVDTNRNIFFKGRKDRQIKINGQRIELSRIEYALAEWSGIDEWVFVIKEKALIAFSQKNKQAIPVNRKKLKELLPAYAIPSFIEKVDQFPLNKNGKVDIMALEKIAEDLIKNSSTTSLSIELENILKDVFPEKNLQSRLGWYANGFNSLDAMRLSGKIKLQLNKTVGIETILTCLSLNQILQEEEETNQEHQPVLPDTEVHEEAARLFFLSESDDHFNKTYWIINGFSLPYSDSFLAFIKKWFAHQSGLGLKIESHESKYYWKKAAFHIHDIAAKTQTEYIDKLMNYPSSIFNTLGDVFVSVISDRLLVSCKIHHGLLDGIGMQQLLDTIVKDYEENTITTLRLLCPYNETADLAFWKTYLQQVKIQGLPFKRLQPISKENHIRIPLSADESKRINELRIKNNCSSFEAGLILWSTLWKSYFPDKDFATGIVVNTRQSLNPGEVVAMSANILPWVIESSDDKEIIEKWRHLFKKRKQSFSQIVTVESNKQQEGTPFFNTTYVYNTVQSREERFASIPFGLNGVSHDISLDFIDDNGVYYFQWEYNPNYFSGKAMEYLHHKMFQNDFEENKNCVEGLYDLKELIVQMAEKYPDNTAISLAENKINYRELHEKIQENKNKFHYQGTGIVPLILERTTEDLLLVLSCIYHQIPFIPIDAETPDDRIAQIEELCGERAYSLHNSSEQYAIQANSHFDSDIVYAIATSGTTGTPKLVGVCRSGYAAAIEAWKQQYSMQPTDKIMQAASFSFDVFMGDIGRSIFNGAALVLTDKYQRKDPTYLADLISHEKITVFETTPMIVRWWMETSGLDFSHLRLLIVGSDVWKIFEMQSLINKLPAKTTLISSYGLSETTIDNSYFTWQTSYARELVVPIGKPMLHSEFSICKEDGTTLPAGKEGLLRIGGPCVGKGYYLENGWSHNSGPWTTADKAVMDEFGNYHFLGRADKQVKIRGQRLELQEIEVLLTSIYPKTEWVAFTYDNEFAQELGAAYIGNIAAETIQNIRQTMLAKYPPYYLPSRFIAVDHFEMTQNGKINRDSLKDILPVFEDNAVQQNPDSNITDQLSTLIYKLFNRKINSTDNFFALGFSSFDAMYFVREWNNIHEKRLAVHQLFAASDFNELANTIEFATVSVKQTTVEKTYQIANRAQEAIWVEIQQKDPSVYNLPHFIEIPGDINEFKQRAEETLKACENLFVCFEVNERGQLLQHYLSSDDYVLAEKQMSASEFIEFQKKTYYVAIDLIKGPCFEAFIIHVESKSHLYFNPHHLVYDGGSDEWLLNLFFNEQERRNKKARPELNQTYQSTVSTNWDNYFSLSTSPQNIAGLPASKLEKNIVTVLADKEVDMLKKLQQQWKTSASVIHANLLANSLKTNGLQPNWISFVMDTRDEPAVGMFMRAFPFPAPCEGSWEQRIGISKAAITYLFSHKNDTIVYPPQTNYEQYHQIGLIIQHPVETTHDNELNKEAFSRPRQPLSLYVETFKDKVLLRWEYDSGYFKEQKIKEVSKAYLDTLTFLFEAKIIPKEIDITESVDVESKNQIRVKGQLNTIWEKYVGPNGDNHFFKAGGTSLQAIMMLREIQKTTGFAISLTEFFKQPTFDKLAYNNTSSIKAEDYIIDLKKGIEGEDWYFPPIMGLGLIFNTYPLQKNHKAVAFNYPMAVDVKLACSTIEETASFLISSYEKTRPIPKKINKIVAYSMGGIVAFEVIKLLEKMGTSVDNLIVWDKSAQDKLTPFNKHTVSDIKDELISIIDKISPTQEQKANVLRYINQHQDMIENYLQEGKINCPIKIFYCERGFKKAEIKLWSNYTLANCEFIPINTTHYEIPEFWKQHGELNLSR